MKRRGFTLEIPELDDKNASHLPNKCEAFYFPFPVLREDIPGE